MKAATILLFTAQALAAVMVRTPADAAVDVAARTPQEYGPKRDGGCGPHIC